MIETLRHPTFVLVAFALAAASLQAPAAAAALVTTEQAIAAASHAERVDRVRTLLRQEAVAERLIALGVDVEEAALRVAALSPAELERLETGLEELPAGAGLLEVIGIVFVVLLILELVGVTNVFSQI
jgi:hypothetical protein